MKAVSFMQGCIYAAKSKDDIQEYKCREMPWMAVATGRERRMCQTWPGIKKWGKSGLFLFLMC
jgi:hypothetical protein